MKTVFILFQEQYYEGNFGDLEQGQDKLIGVFETEQAAEAEKLFIDEPTFEAQFGSSIEKTFIVCAEIKK